MIDDFDAAAVQLRASGWAAFRKDPLGGMDEVERAMAKRLLERRKPVKATKPLLEWSWHVNTLGRIWWLHRVDGPTRFAVERGFDQATLDAAVKRHRAAGYRVRQRAVEMEVAA